MSDPQPASPRLPSTRVTRMLGIELPWWAGP